MKRNLLSLGIQVIFCLALCACGPGGTLAIPGVSRSSLELPVNSVETWDVTNSKGDKSEFSTVKTGDRDFRFSGKFPSSFFGQPIDVTVAGTINYQSDGTAVLRYTTPLPATVRALYSFRDGGSTLELTTTGSEPAFATIGEKTTLRRKALTTPGS